MAAEIGVPVNVISTELNSTDTLPLGFKGSPTILVNGLDIDPAVRGKPDSGHG
ncbi:MAG: hypothetical protein HQ519_13705 [Planctomycetes bacterium]|nr:hypothetical protein [Planctomycetota bacterium]